MIELVDTAPDVSVQPAEYRRLLGYPPDRELGERACELADWARAWYARNGHPWSTRARQTKLKSRAMPFASRACLSTANACRGCSKKPRRTARSWWRPGPVWN